MTEIKRYPWEYVWGYMGCDLVFTINKEKFLVEFLFE